MLRFPRCSNKGVKKRNKKKLYSEFNSGNIKNIVGLDIKAEFPVNPDIKLNNYEETSRNLQIKFLNTI